jgi:cyanophycin synthetase
MRIDAIRALYGPNVYSNRPVLLMKLDLAELADRETRELPGFNERLLALLPGLGEHFCGLGYAGGFVERLNEGTFFGHTVEHVALELTELAGVPSYFGKTREAGRPGWYNIIIEYQAERGTMHLLRTAVELVEALVRGETYPLDEEIAEAKRLIARTELGPSTRTIVQAAERLGIPWQRLNQQSLVQLGYGKNRKLIAAALTSHTSAIGADIASDKDLTKRLLNRVGLPVPQGEIVHSEAEAIQVFEWLHKPVAIKPCDGHQGKGVSLNLYTPEQVAEGFRIAREHSREVLVEELFVGRDFRVLVVKGKLIAAAERIPAHVLGDGEHTIAELIEAENRNPLRGEGHDFPLTKIEVDDVVIAYLRKNELSLQDVPEAGRKVSLRENANLSKGGTALDVTDAVHPGVRRACERAAEVVGLDICGIDLVLPDIAQPIPPSGACIIEVNAAPGLRMHAFPSAGQPRDVGGAIIQTLYPFGSTSRIPIISLTGTNGKTTIARLIAHLLALTGRRVGLTTTDGIYLNGELIVAGDTTGPRSAQVILSDPTVEIAVLEVARGGLLRGGLAYDWSDISVMSNIQPDHLGQDGLETVDDLLWVKSVVAERVKEGGTLILNADDERLARLPELRRITKVQKKFVYYSLDPENPVIQASVAQGRTVYFLRDGWLIESVAGTETRVIEAAAVPLTLGGRAEFQISNVLAALAAARAYGRPAELIAEALRNYTAQRNTGRGNLYRVGAGFVLVDYGHNPEAIAAVGRTLKGLNKGRLTAVLGVPGDRNDEVIRQAGRVAAMHFDRLILREDKDLRGRQSGETPRLLYLAAEETRPGIECRVVLDEPEALALALREVQPDEIIAVFYEKLAPLQELLLQHGAHPVDSLAAGRPTEYMQPRAGAGAA